MWKLVSGGRIAWQITDATEGVGDQNLVRLQMVNPTEFRPSLPHCTFRIRQSAPCQGWGREFESHRPLQFRFDIDGLTVGRLPGRQGWRGRRFS